MSMTAQNKVNDQIFGRINKIESKVDGMTGYLKGVVETNEKLIDLFKRRDTTLNRVVWALIALLFFALGVIAFGAIGKEGMHSVRKTMPTVPTAAIPRAQRF